MEVEYGLNYFTNARRRQGNFCFMNCVEYSATVSRSPTTVSTAKSNCVFFSSEVIQEGCTQNCDY